MSNNLGLETNDFRSKAEFYRKTLEAERAAREAQDKNTIDLLYDLKSRYETKINSYMAKDKPAVKSTPESKKNKKKNKGNSKESDNADPWADTSNDKAETETQANTDTNQNNNNDDGGWDDGGNTGWGDTTEDQSKPDQQENRETDQNRDNNGDWDDNVADSGWGNATNDNAETDGWGDAGTSENKTENKADNKTENNKNNKNKNKNKNKDNSKDSSNNNSNKNNNNNNNNKSKKETVQEKKDDGGWDNAGTSEWDQPTSSPAKDSNKEKEKAKEKHDDDRILKKKLDQINQENDSLRVKMRGLAVDLCSAREEIEKLNSQKDYRQMTSVESLLQDKDKIIKDLTRKNLRLEADLSQSKNLIRILKDGCAFVENQAKTFEVRHDTVVMSKADMERELINIKEESSRHITTINRLQRSNEKLSQAFIQSAEAHDQTRAELEMVQRESARRLMKLREENERLVIQNNQLNKLIDIINKKR